MKNQFSFLIILSLFFYSCVATKNRNYTFNQKYSAAQVKQDIHILKEIYDANHPSLYWYISKDSLNILFENVSNSIKDSLTEIECRKKVASIISQIKCGHTNVAYSKQFTSLADKNKYPSFPLLIKLWKDTMVTYGYFNKADSMLKPGTIIHTINGKKVNEICAEIFQYISTDGDANNFKYQYLTNSFPTWYKNSFGLDSIYTIEYFDSNKKINTTSVKWYFPKLVAKSKQDTTKSIIKQIAKPTLSNRQQRLQKIRSYSIDTSLNSIIIKLNSFSGGNLKSFFDDCFDEIKEKKIENLVVDIRENTGGSVSNSIDLLKYLKKDEFKIADSCYAISRNFKNKKYIKSWFGIWLLTEFFSKKTNDGFLHNRTFETKKYKPYTKKHFDGNIYIIQGGYSFSAATIFSSFLKSQSNVIIVGEESGGGFYGNTAMLMPTIYLPNTKLKVKLPLYRYVMDKNRPKGRGVLPDIEVLPSTEAIKKGIDLKLQKVKELIKNKRNGQA